MHSHVYRHMHDIFVNVIECEYARVHVEAHAYSYICACESVSVSVFVSAVGE